MRSRSALVATVLAFACFEEGAPPPGPPVGVGSSGSTTTAETDAGGDGPAADTGGGADETTADETTAAPVPDTASTDGRDDEGETSAPPGSTGDPPTSGPGVLPGESGLEAFCRRYFECGGSYFDGFDACIDASLDYWGTCRSRRSALDEFGACMAEIPCEDYDPDAYNPSSTVCADAYAELQSSPPC